MNPCPMCGKEKQTQEEQEIESREHAEKYCEAFIRGMRVIEKLSTREKEIIYSIVDLGMDFDQAARNFGINKKTVYTYWKRALEKINS